MRTELVTTLKRQAMDQRAQKRCTTWRASSTGNVPEARQALREVLRTPLWLTATDNGYPFEGELVVDRLLVGEVSN